MSVVDASFLTALSAPSDAFHDRAVGWYESHDAPPRLRVPSIALAELAAGLRQQGTSIPRIQESIATARRLLSVYTTDEGLALRAAEITAERTIRGCDAVYVALAERLGEELVTFDRQQARAAEGLIVGALLLEA